MTEVKIDSESGFCFGVTSAINTAEHQLRLGGTLYCLGDIVHNGEEVSRLHAAGLVTISHRDLATLHDARVLLRAHGEPPSTYATARANNIEIIDATCPVVLKLQQRVKDCYDRHGADTDIVIYGKKGHAEVMGLVGQTGGHAIVVESVDALMRLHLERNVALFSQTTMPIDGFKEISQRLRDMLPDGCRLEVSDTICRRVANRSEGIKRFASSHELILFVAGAKSSNGRILYNVCRDVNERTYLISSEQDIQREWLEGVSTIGICGATSTPRWLMERVKAYVELLEQASRAI